MCRVNVFGVFWCMQAQIKAMLRHGAGHIVNISSVAGLHGLEKAGTYSGTKHAVRDQSLNMCLEMLTLIIRSWA